MLARVLHSHRLKVVYLVLLIVFGWGSNLVWTAHVTTMDDRQWCETLNLLTRHPVPKPTDPAANPSRERSYEFYAALVTLKHRKGC